MRAASFSQSIMCRPPPCPHTPVSIPAPQHSGMHGRAQTTIAHGRTPNRCCVLTRVPTEFSVHEQEGIPCAIHGDECGRVERAQSAPAPPTVEVALSRLSGSGRADRS